MTQPSTASGRAAFLPAPVTAFLRRRLAELIALGLVALAVLLVLAVASHAPGDPSFNNAAPGPAANLTGLPGAYVADVLLQSLGVAAFLPSVVLAAWAWRIGSHRGLARLWLHLLLVAPLLVGAAAGVSSLAAAGVWFDAAHPGGWLGEDALARLAALAHAAALPVPPVALAAVLALLSAMLLPLTLGLSGADWRALGRGAARLSRWGWWAIAGGVTLAVRFRRLTRWRAGPPHRPRSEPHLGGRRAAGAPELARDADPDSALGTGRGGPSSARVTARPPRPPAGRRTQAEQQPALDLAPGEFCLPSLSLLATPPSGRAGTAPVNAESLEQNARLLEAVLDDFGVRGQITKVRPGPVVTLYELEPAPGTKSSRVIGLADDIARSMSAVSVRAAVVAGHNAIGIELPNAKREPVSLRELLASAAYEGTAAKLTLVLGKDISGGPVIADLARMPHLLIAGTTGSGKSVAVNTMILSLLYRLPPEDCKLILIDPKMLELSAYDGIPQLLTPVVVDPAKAVVALKWTVQEMEDRYRAMSRLGVRNITSYNHRVREARAKGEVLKRTVQTGDHPDTGRPLFEDEPLKLEPIPYIVVVVDEMADLMILAGKEIEGAIQRLSQMARAAGIHIIMATQRPSVDVITGTIKANFPTRISFQVTSRVDSRTILGEQGAEQLLGSGDMLFMQSGGRITRVHGPFVSEEEVKSVVDFLKLQGKPDYLEAVTAEPDSAFTEDPTSPVDELYDKAVALVCNERKASTSFIQRHLQVGYNRAARIIERMEREGVVGAANHVGKREVLARSIDALE